MLCLCGDNLGESTGLRQGKGCPFVSANVTTTEATGGIDGNAAAGACFAEPAGDGPVGCRMVRQPHDVIVDRRPVTATVGRHGLEIE